MLTVVGQPVQHVVVEILWCGVFRASERQLRLLCCCHCCCMEPSADKAAAAQPFTERQVLHHKLKHVVWQGA